MRLDPRERRDLLVAWLALGLAFALFFEGVTPMGLPGYLTSSAFVSGMVLSLLTVGVGFLLHELAHKVVATRFDRIAHFRADYGMLFVAVLSALAGPATNMALAVAFVPLLFVHPLLGSRGVTINLLLGAFNLLPVGGLDGATIKEWSGPVWIASFAPSVLLALWVLFGL